MTYAKALQEAKDTCKECLTVNDCVKEECRWYHIINALERQIPDKPNVSDGFYRYYICPACERSLVAYTWEGGIHYCHCCGQAIDWGDAE